jgi:hypothetical protein
MRIIKSKVYNHKGETFVELKYSLGPSKNNDIKECKTRLDVNEWLLPFLTGWADFDYHFTLDLLIASLKALGKGLYFWNNVVGAERNAKRCYTAAALLKQAYTCDLHPEFRDKAWEIYFKRHPISYKKKDKNTTEVSFTKNTNQMKMDEKEYDEKMWHLMFNKDKSILIKRKQYAWKYLHKYLEHWWD